MRPRRNAKCHWTALDARRDAGVDGTVDLTSSPQRPVLGQTGASGGHATVLAPFLAAGRVEYRIEPVGISDLYGIAALDRVNCANPLQVRALESMLVHEGCYLAMACDNCKILGYVVARPAPYDLEVVSLVVDARVRKAGIGRELMRELYPLLNTMRRTLRVPVGDDNLPAHLFLRKLGFTAKAVLRDQDGVAIVYVFEKTSFEIQQEGA